MAQFYYMYFDLFEQKLADGEETVCAIVGSIDIRQNVLCGLLHCIHFICVIRTNLLMK